MYARPHEKCPGCGVLLNLGVVFINVPENCDIRLTYPYMKIGEAMHMECYIQHVIDTHINKNISDY